MTVVSLVQTRSNPDLHELEAALERSLEYLGGISSFVFPGIRVLIKPNVGSKAPPGTGVNTDPDVTEALINLLRKAGVENITVAESAIVGVDTGENFSVAGFTDLPRRTGISLIDLKETPYVEIPLIEGLALNSIKVFQPVLDSDLLINLPTMKTITSVPVSLGMKNLKGLIPDTEKRRFHYTDLNQSIVDLNRVIRPQITIIDGIRGSELYQLKEMNLLIAGRDVVAVDTVGAAVMGVNPEQIKYLNMAQEAGLGKADLDEIEIRGEKIAEVRKDFRQAMGNIEGFKEMFPEVDIVMGAVCTSCLSCLNKGLTQARAEGLLNNLQGYTLVIGPGARAEEGKRAVYIGNCLKKHQDDIFLPGCPFISMDLVQFLKENIR